MVRFGIPGQNVNGLAYADDRLSAVPMVQAPRRPTVTDKKYPMWCEWRVNKHAVAPAEEGEFWKLVRFESNGDATWVMLSGGDEDPLLTIETDDGAPPVEADINGNVKVLGGAGISVTGNGPGDTVTVSLTGGGAAIDQIDVDFNTAPGTDPVLPDANGQISVSGNVVANGANPNAPVATHSRNANEYQIDIQLAKALAPTPIDFSPVGLSSYDNRYFNVSFTGFVGIEERLLQEPIGTTLNLGMSYSSPTFTIHDSQGNTLSPTNPAWVVVRDPSSTGLKKVFSITQNYSFDDASGTSDIIGNTFGTTSGVAWSSPAEVPFWLYFVINDSGTDVTPMISRHFCANITTSNIGKPSSSIADSQSSFWALDDSITESNFEHNPCSRVGTFRMIKNSSDDWTVVQLSRNDGIGMTNFGSTLVMAALQNGAVSTFYSSSNGGDTLPTFANQGYGYYLTPGGYVHIDLSTTGVTNSPSGVGDLRIHLPYQANGVSWFRNLGGFSFDDQSKSNGTVCGSVYFLTIPSNFFTIRSFVSFTTASTSTTALTPGDLANGDGNFSYNFSYRAFEP